MLLCKSNSNIQLDLFWYTLFGKILVFDYGVFDSQSRLVELYDLKFVSNIP